MTSRIRPLVASLLIALGLVVVIATHVYAGSYTFTTTAGQDAKIDRQRLKRNAVTCASVQLPPTCTDAEAKALNPALEVFANNQAFLSDTLKGALQDMVNQQTQEDRTIFCTNFKASSTAAKNTTCTSQGLPNGCDICP